MDQHIDNFSLLPPSADPSFGLLFFWFYIEDVPLEFGPTRFWPTSQGGNGSVKSFDQQLYEGPTATGPAFDSALPAGSLVIFTSGTIHGRNTFKVPYGQRYVLKHSWGRADADWEGQGPMGNIGLLQGQPDFQRMVTDITPEQRRYLSFPAVGDDYYTPATLRELERMHTSNPHDSCAPRVISERPMMRPVRDLREIYERPTACCLGTALIPVRPLRDCLWLQGFTQVLTAAGSTRRMPSRLLTRSGASVHAAAPPRCELELNQTILLSNARSDHGY